MAADLPVDVEHWRQRAKARLPRVIFDYLDGGAEAELALADNRAALDQLTVIPRMLRDVAIRDTSTTLLGQAARFPVAIAPTGCNGLIHPEGDILLACAAARAGIPFFLSTAANSSIARVKQASGAAPWFQLYITERSLADRLIDMAEEAGCEVLCLTVDVPVGGKRLRDQRNGFSLPLRWSMSLATDVASHPRWLWGMRKGVPAFENLRLAAGDIDPLKQAALLARRMDASFDWRDLERLRARWPRKLVVKGLMHADDAQQAVACGVDAVVVSNHGGRQLDGAPASARCLPAVVEALAGRAQVLVDSGVRRGEDILKLLALGADGVLLGRAALYGLAAAGEHGVAAVLALLRDELDRCMALAGAATIAEIRKLEVNSRKP